MRADGGIAAQSGGVTLAAHPSSGTHVLNFGSAATGHAILASGGYAGDNAEQRGETSHVVVQTRTSAGTLGDHSFYVAVF